MSTKKDRMRPKGKPRKVQIPAQVEQWLRRAFIIDHDGLIPKTAMYENYEAFCRSIKIRPRPPNTFGKLLVVVHPHIRTRRMGPHSCQVAYYAGISPQVHDGNDNGEMSDDNISLNSSTNSNDFSTDSETPSSSPPSSPFLSSSIPNSPRSASSFSLVTSPPSSPQFYSRAPTTPHFDNTPTNQFWIHETKTPALTTTTTPNKTDDVSWINNMDSEMNGWLASLAEDILYQEQIQYQQQQQQLVALQEQQRQLEQQRQQLEQWAVMRRQQQQQVQMQMQMQMQQQLLHVDGTSTEEEWKNWLALEDEAASASTTTTNTTVHTQTTRHQFDLVNIRPFVATVFN